MKKSLFILSFTFFLFFFTKDAYASLLLIDKNGEIVWKVLSSQVTFLDIPKSSAISVKNLTDSGANIASQVSLAKDGEKFVLSVNRGSQEKSLDVTLVSGDLIEIEERPEVRIVKIGISGSKFTIDEDNVLAITDYPIKIDAERAELSVVTETGQRILPFLPKEALETLLRAGVISRQNMTGTIELNEAGRGELTYEIPGEKDLNLVNILQFRVPVTSTVSAITGEILSVDEPRWLRIFGFLFS